MKDKKIVIPAIIIVILILAIIILSIIKSNPNKDAKVLNDPNRYFAIQKLVTSQYEDDFMSYSFIATEIYYKEYSYINVYFIKGYEIINDMETTYYDNIYYLVKLQGAIYEIDRLNNITNIKEYADNYEEENEKIYSNELAPSYQYDEKNKVLYYIYTFKNYLRFNPEKAYDLLTDNQKNKYQGLNDFKNKAIDIDDTIETYIQDYQHTGNEYTVTTKNNKTITIYEKSIMNYQIEY